MSAHSRISVPAFDYVWAKVRKSAGKISDDTAWLSSWNRKSITLMVPVFIGLALFVVGLLLFFGGKGLWAMLAIALAVLLAAPSVVYVMRHASAASNEHTATMVAPVVYQLREQMSAQPRIAAPATSSATHAPTSCSPIPRLRHSRCIYS